MYGEKMTRFQRFTQRFSLEPIDIVQAELKDAMLANLQAISESEYAALQVKMHDLTAEYHYNRAVRMQEYIQSFSGETQKM